MPYWMIVTGPNEESGINGGLLPQQARWLLLLSPPKKTEKKCLPLPPGGVSSL